MTLLNFTFQEASPLIVYSPGSPGWGEGNPALDPLAANYNGSFHLTSIAGSSATLTFFGTGVTLFGATRPNHGNYTVNLDQQPQFVADGSTPDTFNKSLWSATNLEYSQHTVKITNVHFNSGTFLDLDFVSINRQIGQPGDKIFQTTIDDTSTSAINFTGSWQSTTGVSSAHAGTLHGTTTANSEVAITFKGCCIEVYGLYANAKYTVVVDDTPPVNMSGLDADLSPQFQYPQTLLYLIDGLSDGPSHTISLANSDSNIDRPFFFDYAVVSSVHQFNSPAANLTTGPNSPTGTNHPAGKNSTPVGTIVGAAVGGFTLLALLGVGIFLLIRHRRVSPRRHYATDLIGEDSKIITNKLALESGGELGRLDPYEYRSLVQASGLLSHFYSVSKSRSWLSSSQNLSDQRGQSEASGFSHNQGPSTGPSTSTMTKLANIGSPSSQQASEERVTPGSRSTTDENARSVLRIQPSTQVQEEDGGVVLDPEQIPPSQTLPPAYNPVWHRPEE